jgi:integration host factor subunit beta
MNGRRHCSNESSEQDARLKSNKLNGKSAAGGNVMTKRDLIDEVNKRFPHLSRRDSEVIINAIFDAMVDSLAQGDRIEIRGFGSFVVKQRRARQGRNPKSGELVSVAAKRVPFFKVGKELRLRVDGKPYDPEDMDDDGADA